MRILLAQNSLYYPAHGGGDKSNRLLIEALAARGHDCRVLARIPVFGEAEHNRYIEELAVRGVTPDSDAQAVAFQRAGVNVRVVTRGFPKEALSQMIAQARPDVVITSTDDT